MPPLKQPASLEKLAFDLLVEHVVQYCDEHSYEGYLKRFRQGVADVKKCFREYMPDVFLAEFCRRFISEFYSRGARRPKKRPAKHYKAALRMIMDFEIAGLTLEGEILHHLYPEYTDRIRRVKRIDWTAMIDCEYYRSRIPYFDLQDLTVLICPEICSDLDLANVGSYCCKLQVLRIQESKEVTDDGLCALHLCSRLRILNVSSCSVTDYGINEMLSVNPILEEFNVGRCNTNFEAPCFDILSRDKSLVCLSVKRFAFKCAKVTDEHLRSVVEIFPNLTRLEFYRPPNGDVCILKDLKYLEELDFNMSYSLRLDDLKLLLKDIGRRITVLSIDSIGVSQADMNFVFKACPSIERFEFAYTPAKVVDRLLIPASETLKAMVCEAIGGSPIRYGTDREYYVGIDFGVMSVLEYLTLRGFFDMDQILESMIFDHVKFPRLKNIGGHFGRYNKHVARIKQLADESNLDLKLRYEWP